MKKFIFLLCFIFILTLLFGCNKKDIYESNIDFQITKIDYQNEKINIDEIEKDSEENNVPVIQSIKNEVLHSVPFADQAPYKNWGDPYQEACEEASIIMANQFIKNNKSTDLDKDFINQEILDMVLWQDKNFNGHYDLDIQSTLDLFRKYYNYKGGEIKVINSPEDIKQILSDGYIIIAPTYGRALDNPNFTAPGPVYHMLVIKGYDDANFITNDPGVWQGKNFIYSYDNLYEAIRDLPEEAKWKYEYIKTNPNLMKNGDKKILIIK